MLGSAASISRANTTLNTAVAEELRQFADALEDSADFENDLHEIIKKTIKEHKRIIFNGNGYDDAWVKQAEERGLLNLRTTPDALPYFLHEKNVKLFTEHKVYSKVEMEAFYEILMENYCKIINIEALTMQDMARKDILPAMSSYIQELSETCLKKAAVSADVDCVYEKESIKNLSALQSAMYGAVKQLEEDLQKAKDIEDVTELGNFYRDSILADMREVRANSDQMETIASAKAWPYPSYGAMLFSVR